MYQKNAITEVELVEEQVDEYSDGSRREGAGSRANTTRAEYLGNYASHGRGTARYMPQFRTRTSYSARQSRGNRESYAARHRTAQVFFFFFLKLITYMGMVLWIPPKCRVSDPDL